MSLSVRAMYSRFICVTKMAGKQARMLWLRMYPSSSNTCRPVGVHWVSACMVQNGIKYRHALCAVVKMISCVLQTRFTSCDLVICDSGATKRNVSARTVIKEMSLHLKLLATDFSLFSFQSKMEQMMVTGNRIFLKCPMLNLRNTLKITLKKRENKNKLLTKMKGMNCYA